MKSIPFTIFLLLLSFSMLGVSACQDRKVESGAVPRGTESEPRRVRVQHILIGFEGSLPGERVTRSRAAAEKLAKEIYEQAKKSPADFDKLVRAHSDDRVPGVYSLANFGVTAQSGEFARGNMVTGFGALAFRLKVGEIGLVPYDAQRSPYGYHILMRLPD